MPSRWTYSPEGIAASVLFIFLFFDILIQIVGRTPLFTGPVWTEELARWLWVWMAFLAIGEAERTDIQLRISFLPDLMGARGRRILYTVIDLAYLAVIGHIAWIGWRTILRTSRNEAVTLPVSDGLLYASVFVASLLILYRVAGRILYRFRRDPRLDQSHLDPAL